MSSPISSIRSKGRLRGITLAAAALIALPALTACQAPAEEPGNEELPTLSFGVLRAPTGALAVVTGEEGWFEDAGVDVEFESFAEGGGPAIIQAMAGGTPDIALLNLATAVLALSQGTFDVQVVGIPDDPVLALPLLSSTDITSVEGLRGKRVSTPNGGGQYYLLANILAAHDMTFDDIDFRPMPVGDAQAAFISGSLDAVISSANGTILIPSARDDVHVLATGSDLGGGSGDPVVNPDVLVATRDAIENKPEAIEAFIRAYHDSGIAYLENPSTRAEALKKMEDYMASVGAGSTELTASNDATNNITFYDYATASSLLKSAEFKAAVEFQADFWLEAGVLTSKPDLSNAINSSFMK